MLSHRNIAVADVAQGIGCSTRWLREILNCNAQISKTKYFEWLDRIEDYITKSTDSKGGIPKACCGKAYGDYVTLLSSEVANV